MSWTSIYRLALHLLPVVLRRRHGPAMESLFARELERARLRGSLHAALAATAGIGDVVRRGVYEQLRSARGVTEERRDLQPLDPSNVDAHASLAGAYFRGPLMTRHTTRQLLHRHATSFSVAFVVLTTFLVGVFASKQLPGLRAHGLSAGSLTETVLLAVPFTAALTIPMAVLVAALTEFIRLGANGTLAAARREHDGMRRLIVPVLCGAAAVAVLAFVVTAEIVPRANERLTAVMSGGVATSSGRTMTIAELQRAARAAREDTQHGGRVRAASYEIEIQKKLALPAACVVLAEAGIAIAFCVPRGAVGLLVGAGCAVLVFCSYYLLIITGESLAFQLIVSPFVGMWGANVLMFGAALFAVWWRHAPLASNGAGSVTLQE